MPFDIFLKDVLLLQIMEYLERTSNFPNLKKTEPPTFQTYVRPLKPNFEPPKKDWTLNQNKGS